MDVIGLNCIFYMCPKNFKSFHIFFAEKRRVKCKKKNIFSRRKNIVLLFFIGENNEWIKKNHREEMCGFKCSVSVNDNFFAFSTLWRHQLP